MIFYQSPPDYHEHHDKQAFSFMSFAWDIDKALALVAGREPEGCIDPTACADGFLGPEMTPGQDYERIPISIIGVNVYHALSERVDTTRPIIIAEIKVGDSMMKMIIDGWHRIWRGRHDGIESIPAYILTPEEERSCRI